MISRCLAAPFAVALLAASASAQRPTPLELYDTKQRVGQLLDAGRSDSALVLLRVATAHDSADAYLWRQYARVAAGRNLHLEAARAFEHARRLGVFNPGQTALEAAAQFARAGRPSLALDWLERAARDRLAFIQRIAHDSAFVALRDSARFHAIYSPPDTSKLTRDERWAADVDFFLREAQRLHVHPERPAHSPAFVDTMRAIKARIATSTDLQLATALRRASSMLLDGHSGLALDPKDVRLLPVDLWIFDDGVFIIRGHAGYEKWVGHQVTSIGGRPIGEVIERAGAYTTYDNLMNLRAWVPHAMITVPFLQEMGLADAAGKTTIAVRDRAGRASTLTLPALEHRRYTRLLAPQLPGIEPPRFLRDRGAYWFEELPAERALYVAFTSVSNDTSEPLEAFSRRLLEHLKGGSARSLIVDVRRNGGGNTFLLPPLIQAITHFAAADTAHRVYVLIGRHTFSAAQNFVSKLEWLIDPVFVGEPTGSSPNFTGEGSGTVLPYSGLRLNVSNRVHMNSDWEDQRTWIAPDIAVPLSSGSYFRGEDPVLETVLTLIRRSRPSS